MRWALVAAALALCAPAFAKTKATARDPRAIGLGRRCDKRKDCQGKGNICLRPTDARGKPQQHGFCALPCESFEAGLSNPSAKPASREQPRPDGGTPAARSPAAAPLDGGASRATAAAKKPKKVRSRCPAHFQCRSAGSGVPVDLCVRD
jgi:hypothetical protein